MNWQEKFEKWLFPDRDTTPLWRLPISEITYEKETDPTDGVEIAALAENIRQCGLLHPILVQKQSKGKKYRLIAGQRRLEAVALLGRTHITAIVVKSENNIPLKLMLSENLMRKQPHYLDLAEDIQTLLKTLSMSDISRLFSLKEDYLQSKRSLTVLSAYEKRFVRLLKLSEEDALELCKLENGTLRKLILEKIMEAGEKIDASALIRQAVKSPDFRLTQSEKIFVRDIRIFLNTVERAAEMMQAAGFATDVVRFDGADSYRFTITVAKSQYSPLGELQAPSNSAPPDVSRETIPDIWTNVSRETHENPYDSIDELLESCYNKEVKRQPQELQ